MARKTLVLFDIDGTLTEPMQTATPEMVALIKKLREKAAVGVVGGSNLEKARNQLGRDYTEWVDYAFPENGLVAYHNNQLIHQQELKLFLGEDRLKRLINYVLHHIADLDIPVKRGTFIEFRTGMLNISPIGRNCTQEERNAFGEYDAVHGVRKALVAALSSEFADYNLRFVIGGQISIDVFPEGWDKTYCLRHVQDAGFEQIYFFGDRTEPGENDYEIYTSPHTIGHRVTGPIDTAQKLREIFSLE